MSAVQLHQIRKTFAGTEVLKGIDIAVIDREFMVFVGPSGCGKSTLLRTIAGLERSDSGRVKIGGEDVTDLEPSQRGVAMVFQSYALYPHMSVFENIAFGLRMIKLPEVQIKARVQRAAQVLQIEPLLGRKPRALSGGQRQRVAIGRSIVREPQVFLFDEPLSNLDAALRVQMRLELIKLHKQLAATMIYVTHDQTEAMTMADRIVVLNQGKVEQIGTPLELYRTPVNRFVAGFIGSPKMNFLPVTVLSISDTDIEVGLTGGASLSLPFRAEGIASLPVSGTSRDSGGMAAGTAADTASGARGSADRMTDVKPGDTLTLGIRPEHLSEFPTEQEEGRLLGKVMVVEHLGGETLMHVAVSDDTVIQVKGSGESTVSDGQMITAHFGLRHVHLFDERGVALKKAERVTAYALA